MGDGEKSGRSAASAGEASDPATAATTAPGKVHRCALVAPIFALRAARLDFISGPPTVLRRNRKAIWFMISCSRYANIDYAGVFDDTAQRALRAVNHSASGEASLHRRAARLGAPQVLVEARHDLDEVARAIAIIELMDEDLVPGVTTGAGRARQAEDICGAGDARGGARLDRRGADLGETHDEEKRREAVHALLEQRLDR